MTNHQIVSAAQAAGAIANVGALFAARAYACRSSIAVEYRGRCISYGELADRVERASALLAAHGLVRGERIALLSHNRPEYLELEIAAGNLGIITACLNWRLSALELSHCVDLVSPKLLFAEPDLVLPGGDHDLKAIFFGDEYERLLATCPLLPPPSCGESEDGFVIMFTSGTTGLPKGAVVSHRAMIARALVFASELGLRPDDTFIAWAPMFHMASTDHALATLLRGGTVVIVDGFQIEPLLHAVESHRIGWLVLIPGMIDVLIAAMQSQRTRPRGISICGAMADLVPPAAIAAVTELLQAPYLNSFGSTETGLPPATRTLVPIGEAPTRLSKQQSAFCEIRLVDPADNTVALGEPGEIAMRGPTLFSGYWQATETNAHDFRGGWFHMGDVFRRNADGSLDFVDRAKYLIKSGGENVYPAEIERVLLSDKRISEAAVVRMPHEKWGEVPVAFVSCRNGMVTDAELAELCRRDLAGYKRPQEFRFIAFEEFPRSTSGKVQRHQLEAQLVRKRS